MVGSLPTMGLLERVSATQYAPFSGPHMNGNPVKPDLTHCHQSYEPLR